MTEPKALTPNILKKAESLLGQCDTGMLDFPDILDVNHPRAYHLTEVI
jgi:hypothetical protein